MNLGLLEFCREAVFAFDVLGSGEDVDVLADVAGFGQDAVAKSGVAFPK